MSEDKPQNSAATAVAESPSDSPEVTENTENPPEDSAEQPESVSQPAEHTVESGEIQAKERTEEDVADVPNEAAETSENNDENIGGEHVSEGAGPAGLQARLDKKVAIVSEEMDQKERLVLASIDQLIPEPYHMEWRHDVNQHFSLIVRIRKRQQRALDRDKDAS